MANCTQSFLGVPQAQIQKYPKRRHYTACHSPEKSVCPKSLNGSSKNQNPKRISKSVNPPQNQDWHLSGGRIPKGNESSSQPLEFSGPKMLHFLLNNHGSQKWMDLSPIVTFQILRHFPLNHAITMGETSSFREAKPVNPGTLPKSS